MHTYMATLLRRGPTFNANPHVFWVEFIFTLDTRNVCYTSDLDQLTSI